MLHQYLTFFHEVVM